MEQVRSKLVREAYYFTHHTSGLSVFILPKRGLKKKLGLLAAHYGAIDNAFRSSPQNALVTVPAGIAHYLEHLLFKKPDGDISAEFSRWGALYNALTGYATTEYFFSANEHFRQNLSLLVKLVWQPYFPRENVESERPIIEQEFKMGQDIPELRILHNLLKNLYHSHPIRFEILGTLDSIKNITPENLNECYYTFYHPANMVLAVVGDLEPDEVGMELDKLINTTMNNWGVVTKTKSLISKPIERYFPPEPAQPKKIYQCVEMPVVRPQVLIGYKEQELGFEGEALIKQAIATDLGLELLFGKATKLYHQLYAEGIIGDNFSYRYMSHPSYGFTMIGTETDQPEKFVERIRAGINQARKTRFKKRDLFRLRRKYLGRFIRMFDSTDAIAGTLVNTYLHKINPFDFPRYLKSISLEKIEQRVFEHLDERYYSVSVVKPLPEMKPRIQTETHQ